MKRILSTLCLSALVLGTACSSLSERRTTYNLDGSQREEVRLKASTFGVRSGLSGLHYEINGGSNDLSRSLTIESYERDVSTNAGPAITAAGEATGKTVEAVGGAVGSAIGKAVNTAVTSGVGKAAPAGDGVVDQVKDAVGVGKD